MRLLTPRRPQLPLAYLIAAALASITSLMYLAPSPQAHAESGRRICRYTWNQNVGNPGGRLVSFVVDYEKDGKCPYIDYHKVSLPPQIGSWMPPEDVWEHQPAPKITCEEFQSLMSLPSGTNGGDPCTYMADDVFYAVTTTKPGEQTGIQRLWDLGNARDLG